MKYYIFSPDGIEITGSVIYVEQLNELPPNYVLDDGGFNLDLSCYYMKDGIVKIRDAYRLGFKWNHLSESWDIDLDYLKNSKASEILKACQQTIISGFVSWALGAPHHYPSKALDQQNLAASVLASYDPENESTWTTPFWCSDAAGDWSFVSHTASQIREVGRDAKSSILTFQFKNEQLQAEIQAASNVEALEAIAW